MFKFFKDLRSDIETIQTQIDNLEWEVLPSRPLKERYGNEVLESRLHSVEYKLDALLKHLKLVAEEDENDCNIVTLRKRTKKDDAADKAERLDSDDHFYDF